LIYLALQWRGETLISCIQNQAPSSRGIQI
jgi:hypothetical protein